MTKLNSNSYKSDYMRFDFDKHKAAHIVEYLKIKLKERNQKLDKIRLFKLLFLADYYHINKYGRFICGGNYYAMNKGPVLSELYKEIKEDNEEINSDNGIVYSNVDLDIDEFSDSDIEALNYVIDKYSPLKNEELIEKTHQNKVWYKYYIKDSSDMMPNEEIIEDDKLRKEVKFWYNEYNSFKKWLKS